MPRKQRPKPVDPPAPVDPAKPVVDPHLDALWLHYEISTHFGNPALIDCNFAATMLGICEAILPKLKAEKILVPAGDNTDAEKNTVKKYVLRDVVSIRGNRELLSKIRQFEINWVQKKIVARPEIGTVTSPILPPKLTLLLVDARASESRYSVVPLGF